MEATIISLLISLLGILQNPSIPAEQKQQIYNQVIPIVQNLNRQLHDQQQKQEAEKVEQMKKEDGNVEEIKQETPVKAGIFIIKPPTLPNVTP